MPEMKMKTTDKKNNKDMREMINILILSTPQNISITYKMPNNILAPERTSKQIRVDTCLQGSFILNGKDR